MTLGYLINPEFPNHKIIFYPGLFISTTSLRINTSTKRWIKLRKVDLYVSASTHIFTTCFVLTMFSFDSNNPIWKYGSLPTHRLQSVDQVPPPLVIYLDYTWYTKGSHGPACFSHPGAGSGKKTNCCSSFWVLDPRSSCDVKWSW